MRKIDLKEHLIGVEEELASLILRISDTTVRIEERLPYMRNMAKTSNIYGELQSAMDVWTDGLFINELMKSGLIKIYASEEGKDLLTLNYRGKYNIVCDPFDGSSNLPSNNLVATIIGVYDKDCVVKGKEILFPRGKDQIASMYFLYGPVLSMIYTIGKDVHEFIYRPAEKKFILENENITLPEPPKVYGIGGLRKKWLPKFRKFVEELEEKGLKQRYGGALGGDWQQVVKYGGIFGYPALEGNPNGKLRVLFEAFPIAFIAEQAGGTSSNGEYSILEIQPEKLDQRTPFFVGNKDLIERLEEILQS